MARFVQAEDLAIYQALSYRPGGARMVAADDEAFEEHRFLAWHRIQLSSTDARTGRRVNRPAAEVVQAERDRHHRASSDPPANGPEPDQNDQHQQGETGHSDQNGQVREDRQSDQQAQAGQGGQSDQQGQAGRDSGPEHGPWATPDDTPPPF